MDTQRLLRLQTLFPLAGGLVAWYAVFNSTINYYNQGVRFTVAGCSTPLPILEPCFYGAIGFAAMFFWSVYIARTKGKPKKHQHYFWYLATAGTVFAYYNVAKEFIAYYGSKAEAIGCGGAVITNPFLTPCFIGAAFYLLTAITSGIIYSRLQK